jgi:hypothetical protein
MYSRQLSKGKLAVVAKLIDIRPDNETTIASTKTDCLSISLPPQKRYRIMN